MGTRTTIWLRQSNGTGVHGYWELAERTTENGRMTGIPIYLSVDSGDIEKELAIRLPKGFAIRLLTVLSDKFADEVKYVI